MIGTTKTVAFHTLGCKLNFSETSAMRRLMEEDGYQNKDFKEVADVYVLNTCSVTENANKECRQLIRRIRRQAPDSSIVVTGCYAQLKPEEIAEINGVDLVLGAQEKFNLVSHIQALSTGDSEKICSCDVEDIKGFNGTFSLNDRTRTFLKVQNGCDYNCSFCTIPMARGASRSNTIDGVLKQVEELGQNNVKEVVLTGVNLGDFGKGANGGKKHQENFFELIQALDQEDCIERYRISSIEPNLLSEEIIDFVAHSKHFMPHFHIPLQSGSNRMLGLMRRRYKRELYADRVMLIKELIPHCCIGVDVIVGFPSESDEDFQETVDFLHALDISYLHVFTYSERENTHALSIQPVVPKQERHRRNKVLRNLSYQKMRYFTEQHYGQERAVLFEDHNKAGKIEGYTDNYIRISAPYQKERANQIINWKIS